jgi:hypothetical protein
MANNKELILKYKRYIKKFEEALKMPDSETHKERLYSKISVYKMVIIDLKE